MHDPDAVAFEIRRPWPQPSGLPAAGNPSVRWRIRLHHTHVPGCAQDPPHHSGAFPWWKPSSYSAFSRLTGRDYYWPPMLVIWHREPHGRDALTVCQKRIRRPDGTWKLTRGWHWHIHHWRIQVPPLQRLRRRLLTRCSWCGGRSTKTDVVNISHNWNGNRSPWWRGERGLYHHDCSTIASAHACCVCEQPVCASESSEYGPYGKCACCGKHRAFGRREEQTAVLCELAKIPTGARKVADAINPKENTK